MTNRTLNNTNTLQTTANTFTGTVTMPNVKVTTGSGTAGQVLVSTDTAGTTGWAAPSAPNDISVIAFGPTSVRAAGTGDNPFGVKLKRATTFTEITFRCATADASGNGSYKIQKNGSDVSGMAATSVASTDQVAGTNNGTVTGSWAFSKNDILTLVCVSNGTTPGMGLMADILGNS